jgi:hypothetical protein
MIRYYKFSVFAKVLKMFTFLRIKNQCCGSGMFIPDPGSWFLTIPDPGSRIPDPGSRIPDPKTATKERGKKKLVVIPFYVATNLIVNYFSFEVLKKKIWANFQRIIELFTKKIVKKLLKIWSWDPGSEIRDPEKTYSGSRIRGSKSAWSRIPDPDPQHCKKCFY